jgi:iron complex outermembrane receptor protein
MKCERRTGFSIGLAVMGGILSPLGQAQQSDGAAPTGGLEEIIVTAQKRTENLQEVPISIQSLGAEALEQHGIVSLGDINNGLVPGVNLAPYPGSSDFFFPTFRGITTNTAFISAPNPLAVHVDGVFWSQLVGLNNPAADLERIEILKGPQGVLAGRNATGGVINMHTARPRLGELGFKQELTAANLGQYLSRTIVNLPVGETFAAKLAYLWQSRDDQGIKNTAPQGPEFGEREVNAWRVDLRWQPAGSDVTVDYAYDRSKATGYDTPSQCRYPSPSVTAVQPIVGDPRIDAFVAGCSPSKLDKLYYPFAIPENENVVDGHTLNIDWVVSSALTIRSITGYREWDTSNFYNYGAYAGAADVRSDSGPFLVPGTPFNGQSHPVTLENEAFSQEFQFLGDVSPTFEYTAGVYYSSEDGEQHSGPNVGMYLPSGTGTLGVDFAFVDDKGLHSSKVDSFAVFGQVSWRPDFLDQKLEVVPGVRYTKDDREAVGYNLGWTTGYVIVPTGPGTGMLIAAVPLDPTGQVGFASARGDRSFSQTTPSLSLNYHINDSMMAYAKYVEGYTSGGFDPVSGPGTAAAFSAGFDPETVDSFELGFKGEFFDSRLRTNIALFRSEFTDEQRTVALPSGGWKTENVAESTYEGVELDATAAITENLRLSVSYLYMSHDYDQWIDPTTGQDVTALRDYVVPEGDYNVDLDYRFPDFGLPGKLFLNVNYAHRADTSAPLNLSTPNVRLYSTTPEFEVLNARLTLSEIELGGGSHHRLTVAAWGKNLTDEEYLSLAYQGWVSAGSGSWGDPRTYGLDVRYEY